MPLKRLTRAIKRLVGRSRLRESSEPELNVRLAGWSGPRFEPYGDVGNHVPSVRICTNAKCWVRKCLLLGVDRTYRGHHETDAFDP
jgi:hypothetical protein